MRFTLLCGALAAALTVVDAARAATLTASPTAPALAAISQPDFSAAAFNGGQDFTDNAGPPGQTFTPASALALSGLTVKGFANTSASFGGMVNNATWTVTISRVDAGNVLTRLSQETAPGTAVTNGADYLTFTLATPVPLTAGQQYAFDIFTSAGYYGLAKSSTDVYPGGSAIQHGTTARTSADAATIANAQAVDRTFFINPVPVPEPTSAALLGLAGALTLGRRRRR